MELKVTTFNFPDAEHIIDEIIGFKYDGTSGIRLPVEGICSQLYIPTLEAVNLLSVNNWNYMDETMMYSINSKGIEILRDSTATLVNCFFYGTDENGLLTRLIKWMEIFPIKKIE
ncbi:hypothetical protein [Clostridium sp. YIM B02551]|uniref:hypothetical protein n=1 Tax=Clostridium sp. YIM B02551 TaxID=2910679 RepID=UPI001EEA7F8D|nr:hypothetical protein [Clostridium sp. YIM B02551]